LIQICHTFSFFESGDLRLQNIHCSGGMLVRELHHGNGQSKSPIPERKLILLIRSRRKVVVDCGAKDLKWFNANQVCPCGQMARASSDFAPPT
jgi:hypothetical protein